MEAHNHSQPSSLNSHLPAELFLNSLVEPLAGDSSTASPIAGQYPHVRLETAECVTYCNQSAGLSCFNAQQPDAAFISTDLRYEIWAKELVNDSDRVFILNGAREGFDLIQRDTIVLPAFTKNNRSALKPGAEEQVEKQLCQDLTLGHFGSSTRLPPLLMLSELYPKGTLQS